MLESDRPIALREAILACRNGGVVSVPGVYAGFDDKIPVGALMNKALTIKTGQISPWSAAHVSDYFSRLLERIENGDIDPSFVVMRRMTLDQGPKGYDLFLNKQDDCVKVVLKPQT